MTTQSADLEKALAFLRNPALWSEAGKGDLLGNLSRYCLLIGNDFPIGFIEEIRPFYVYVCERTTVSERLDLFQWLSDSAEKREARLACLLPFVAFDEGPAVISSAALALSVLTPLKNGDPLTGPRGVLSLLEKTDTEATPAGVLQGILLLGDRRVLPLIDGCWEMLGPEGRRLLVHAWSGFVYASTIDFLLAWLERTEDDTDYGAIAAVLASYPLREDAFPFVVDVEREFPANAREDCPPFRVLGQWTFEEYGAVIAPRFKAIGEAETGEKVIPKVLAAWGIA